MEEDVPLIVPEINGKMLEPIHRIIANPNCSTIQLVMVLWPLQVRYGIKRVVVSTYQAVTGSGNKGLEQLERERSGLSGEKCYPHPIDLNVIPQAGSFVDDGYTTEEIKLVNESRKILGLPDLKLTATAVRVPVTGGHSEAVNIELKNPFIGEEIASLLSASNGIVVKDDPENTEYPMPLLARGRDEVFVGRIRRDFSVDHGLNLWIVSDNLRKGAATNAVQIAKYLVDNKILF
jgi:aspartate-semialdehyde dehydrogenase